jgi:hypothetical protein
LVDKSSRQVRSPRAITPGKALAIVELRRRRPDPGPHRPGPLGSRQFGQPRAGTGGPSRLRDPEPVEPVQRYEHAAPGELLHIDIKKLGRIERPSHRVTGNRRVAGAGWEFPFGCHQ